MYISSSEFRVARRDLNTALAKYNADAEEYRNQFHNYQDVLKSQREHLEEEIKSNLPQIFSNDGSYVKLEYFDFTTFREPLEPGQNKSQLTVYIGSKLWNFSFVFEYDTEQFKFRNSDSGFASINIHDIFHYRDKYEYKFISDDDKIDDLAFSCKKFLQCADTINYLQDFDWKTFLLSPENRFPLFDDYVTTFADSTEKNNAEEKYALSLIKKIIGTDTWMHFNDSNSFYNFINYNANGNIEYVEYYLSVSGYRDSRRIEELNDFNKCLENPNTMTRYTTVKGIFETDSSLKGLYVRTPIELYTTDDIRDMISGRAQIGN